MRGRETFTALARERPRRYGPVSMVRVGLCGSGPRDEPARVAYRVGRRVGGAVARNRLRRRLRAAVRANAAKLSPGCAYLVGAEPEASRWALERIEGAVARLIEEWDADGDVDGD